jgi:hypothetical protein
VTPLATPLEPIASTTGFAEVDRFSEHVNRVAAGVDGKLNPTPETRTLVGIGLGSKLPMTLGA